MSIKLFKEQTIILKLIYVKKYFMTINFDKYKYSLHTIIIHKSFINHRFLHKCIKCVYAHFILVII